MDLPPAPHARSAEDVKSLLLTGPNGLSEAEAQARLAQFGKNTIKEEKTSRFVIFFRQFGESGLTGQLTLWTNDYDKQWEVEDWVNRQILKRFRDEKIEIPFRQVDIRMRDNQDN